MRLARAVRTCASLPPSVTPAWQTVQASFWKWTSGMPAWTGFGPAPSFSTWQDAQLFVATRWSIPFWWQSTHRIPRWRCTSPEIAWDGIPFCDTPWHARQFSFFGLPTLKTQRPFSSNFAGS